MSGGGSVRHIAVIGAGIEGVASALELLRVGHSVTLIDPGEPGGEQAASYGNAGWLSSMSVLPPSMPGLWKKIPGFLADPLGPLAIRWRYLPKAAPWLLRYLRAGATEARLLKSAFALSALLRDSPVLHAALAAEAGCAPLIEQNGLMFVYPRRANFEAEAMAWRIRRQVGINWQELDEAALRAREPDLSERYQFGILIKEAGRCLSPGAYVEALFSHAKALGATYCKAAASGFRIEAGRLRAVRLADGGEVPCDGAVIAAGVRSAPLAAFVGNKIPLESERGYHVMLSGSNVGPRGSMQLSDAKMVVNPMRDGLRAAGQVEIAGFNAAPNWKRAEILKNHLLKAFPDIADPFPAAQTKFWMGHRPSTPDGLPCISLSRRCADVVFAFGHGHVGLVAAPRTGRLVAQLLNGAPPEIDITPFAATRFG